VLLLKIMTVSLQLLAFTSHNRIVYNKNNILVSGVNSAYKFDSIPKSITVKPVKLSEKQVKIISKKIKKGKAYLVDVRTPEEFNTKHLSYAKNINFKSANFVDEIKKLHQNKPIYLYCRSGHRSGMAADTLKSLGYTSAYSIGALDSLSNAGFKTEK
jgi:phage shock protein E